MSDNTTLNVGVGGDVVASDDIDGVKYQRVKLIHGADGVNAGDVSSGNGLPVAPQNVSTDFRETFEAYNTATVWAESAALGDIIQLDGNAASASYLVISKDPLTVGGETTITTRSAFTGPFETAVGLMMSQRVLGQECAIELISTDAQLPPVADLAISSISQATTTLTVTTASAHGLSVGARIGIFGVTSDSRMNYPSLVVAAIVSGTTFTCTAGPGGTITSLTVGPYTNQGFVYYRPALGYAQEGVSEIFENATATNASLYVRADAGDVYPSGTVNGNHSTTVGTTASAQLANVAYTYAFVPTVEYRLVVQQDKVNFYDNAVDSANQPSARLNRTTVVPSMAKAYKLRFRVTNNKSLTVPTAKIVSSAKSGSTTATITTDVAHGLTTGDYVVIYGNRDQTNFANLTTATVVASVINTTQFIIAYGLSATATTYGGMVMRVRGGAAVPAAVTTVAVQSAAVTATELTLVGSANWSWSVGDYVNVYGVRNNTTGADLGVDGVYKVANTSTSTLVLVPISSTVLPAPFTTTNCGGTVLKRTDVRISYVRLMQYLRERVEVLNKSDAFSSLPVVSNGGFLGTLSTASLAINTIVNDITSAALTSTTTTSAITPGSGALTQEFNVIVTAVTGSTPTLDFVVQESDDSGSNWYDVYHFPRITATGQYRSPLIPLTGNRVRYVQTLSGGTPSFTRSVNRLQSHAAGPVQRQFFDRTMAPNTLDSVTPTFFIEGCSDLNVMVSMGAVTTTAPTLAVEVSPNGADWVQVGADIATAASANALLQVTNALSRFARVRVKSAGNGATLSYLMIKGIGR